MIPIYSFILTYIISSKVFNFFIFEEKLQVNTKIET